MLTIEDVVVGSLPASAPKECTNVVLWKESRLHCGYGQYPF